MIEEDSVNIEFEISFRYLRDGFGETFRALTWDFFSVYIIEFLIFWHF